MPLRRCGSSASASTSSGRPSRRHPSPCDASVLAPGATRPTCALVTRALWPLEMVAIDAQCPGGAAFADGGLQAPLRRGGGAACTKCALLSWRPPSVRSAVCARGHVRRMALVSQPSIRGHCSSGYLLERARVPADAAAVVVRRARVDAWVGDEVPMTLLRWRRVTAAAPTRCGRPLRGHASPCDAPVLASGATECRWRHYHRHRCPGRRARLPLGWLPSTPDSRVLPPPATEGHRRRGAEGGALPGSSARYLRGSCCRRAVPCEPAGPCAPNCHWRRSHRCGCTARASACACRCRGRRHTTRTC